MLFFGLLIVVRLLGGLDCECIFDGRLLGGLDCERIFDGNLLCLLVIHLVFLCGVLIDWLFYLNWILVNYLWRNIEISIEGVVLGRCILRLLCMLGSLLWRVLHHVFFPCGVL